MIYIKYLKQNTEWDRVTSIVVTLSLTMGWLPAYIVNVPAIAVSLTRWIAIPLMILSITVFESRLYIPIIKKKSVFFLFFSFVIGMVGGMIVGAVPSSLVLSFIPNLIILLYYMRVRDITSLKRISYSLIISSWILGIIVMLAGLGIVHSNVGVTLALGKALVYERTWAGVSSSLLGPYMAILMASLGGYFLFSESGQKSLLTKMIAIFTFVVSLYVAVITAQRSIVVIELLSMIIVLSGILFINGRKQTRRNHRNRWEMNFLSFAVIIIVISLLILPKINERSLTLKYRFSAMNNSVDYYGGGVRMDMWRFFINDLIHGPQLIGKGDSRMVNEVGAGPHLLLGEAYYYGGVLLLVSLIMIPGMAVINLINAIRFPISPEWNSQAWFIIGALIPTLVYLMIMPGFVTRIPYILIGMACGISSVHKMYKRNIANKIYMKSTNTTISPKDNNK